MKKTIKDFNLEGKKLIIRCDFNVPIKNGNIIDETRIKESLETIRYAINHQAKVILLSHLGRVKTTEDLEKNTLLPVATRLGKLLEKEVSFIPKTRGKEVEEKVSNMKNGDMILLENTRYEDLDGKKESTNNEELASSWASLGDIFINDAFGTLHRAHASNVGISSLLPNGIGFLVEKELKALSKLNQPDVPYIVILGGAKVSDKIGVIEYLIPKVDKMIIGGAMAFTFLKAKDLEVGKSLVEEEKVPFCREILAKYPDKIILPVDTVVALEIGESVSSENRNVTEIGKDEIGLDLGEKSIQNIKESLRDAKTVVWNGPLGYYEIEKYRTATKEILEYLTEKKINTILGGGDIVAASSELGYKEKVSHASTGGGATLEYLEGKALPGLAVIEEK